MWGSEFLNETLIMLLLLFHITEQLLIRKKKNLIFKIVRVTNKNVTERFISKLGAIFWAILDLFLPWSPVNNHKKSF